MAKKKQNEVGAGTREAGTLDVAGGEDVSRQSAAWEDGNGDARRRRLPAGTQNQGAGTDFAGTQNYDAGSIRRLKGLEAVRERPGMYIGDTNEAGLHHCVREIVDNSIDEALAGFCTEISVAIHADGSVSVEDNGRGIPVAEHPEEHISTLELVLTNLHAGGKFGKGAYQVSGGLNGVGAKCVNALSDRFVAQVCRDGNVFSMEFSRGKVVKKLQILGNTKRTGTKITFHPDPEIFTVTEFNFDTLKSRLRELAFLVPAITIRLCDERLDSNGRSREETFRSKNGLADFVTFLSPRDENGELATLFPRPILISETVDITDLKNPVFAGTPGFREQGSKMTVDVAIFYNKGFSKTLRAFTNLVTNPEGGTHVSGFSSALTRTTKAFAKANNWLKNGEFEKLIGKDFEEGLVAVISVKHPDPKFQSQNKVKLTNPEVEGIVAKVVANGLRVAFGRDSKMAKAIIDKALLAAKVRRKIDGIRGNERDSTSFWGKLADCSSKNPEDCEIYLVEGDSAGGSAKSGRNRRCQAILPLRGKILNVERASRERVFQNEEIRAMITAFGCGSGEKFDLKKARYHKIVIMTDADVDGAHIRTLLLTFFFRYLRGLIEAGFVYIAQPPLYLVSRKKKQEYVQTDADLARKLIALGAEDLTLIRKRDGRAFPPEKVKKIVRIMAEIESKGRGVTRLNCGLAEYLQQRRERAGTTFGGETSSSPIEGTDFAGTLELPRFLARVRVGNKEFFEFMFDDSEKADFYARHGIDDFEKTASVREIRGNDGAKLQERINVYEIFEAKLLTNLLQELEAICGNVDFAGTDSAGTDFGFELVESAGTRHAIGSLLELIAKVREIGSRGLRITRYKGLGEMDARELYETTMNPETRTFLRVRISDFDEASGTIQKLMGDDVPPRTEFIYDNALNASYVDI